MVFLKLKCRKCETNYADVVEDKKDYRNQDCDTCGEQGFDNIYVEEVTELRTYLEWVPTYERLNGIRILDPDGYRRIFNEGKADTPMTYKQACEYLILNTIIGAEANVRQINNREG